MTKHYSISLKKSASKWLFGFAFLVFLSINFQYANAQCVNDTEAPLPDNPNLPDITGECSVLLSRPTAYDLCENKAVSGTVVNNKLTYSVGTYTVTWTYVDGTGNSVTQDQKVIVDSLAPPTIYSNKPTLFCKGDSITLTSSSATNNVWNNTIGTTYTTPSVKVKTNTTYTLTYTSGGCSSIAIQKVTVNDSLPVVPVITSQKPSTFCKGQFVILKSSSSTANTWSVGTTIFNTINLSTADSLKVDTSGTFYVTVKNGCGSTRSLAKTVIVKPSTVSITVTDPTSVCPGTSVTLVSNSVIGNTWSTGSTNDSLTVTPNATKTYSLTLSNGCGPVSRASKKITVFPLPPKPTYLPSAVCGRTTGGIGALTGTPMTGGSPEGGTYSGSGIIGNNFSPLLYSFLGGGAPFTQVVYTITDTTTGCSNSTTSILIVDTSAATCGTATDIKKEISSAVSASVFPNPTSGSVNISIKNSSANQLFITVFDALGTEVFNASDKKIASDYNKQIDLSGLAGGVYTIRLTIGSEMITQKLIIE